MFHVSVMTMARPVIVQMISVSIMVPIMETRPCLTGSSVWAAAAAMGALPRPASLEKIPRETPFFILRNMEPITPPVAALGEKAPLNISPNTAGTCSMFMIITPRARITYNTAMKGTSFSVTWPIRLMPPNSTIATSAAIKMPKIRFALSLVPSMIWKLIRAELMEATMVFTCVALPVPNTVSTPNTA